MRARRHRLLVLGCMVLGIVFLVPDFSEARGRFGGGGRGGGGMSRGGGMHGGGGGMSRGGTMSRGGGMSRGSVRSRPGGSSWGGRPTTRQRPTTQPSTRPSTRPADKRPGGGPGDKRPGDKEPGDRQEDRQDWRDQNREDWQSHADDARHEREEFYEDSGWYYGGWGYGYGTTTVLIWGTSVSTLPPNSQTVYIDNRTYQYSDGNYYAPDGDKYKTVEPPVGATVDSIPKDAKKKTVGDKTYFVLGETYYQAFYSGGSVVYKVVEKPA